MTRATEEDTHMADRPPYPDSKPPTTPRWVKVFGIIAIVLVLLVVLLLTGVLGSGHGPGRHVPGGDTPGGHTPPIEHTP
jgi:hypothetical protein